MSLLKDGDYEVSTSLSFSIAELQEFIAQFKPVDYPSVEDIIEDYIQNNPNYSD